MSAQPEALHLADYIDGVYMRNCSITQTTAKDAAAELRRLHEVNAELLEALKYARRMAHPADCDIGFLDAVIAKAEGEMK